MLIGPAGIGKSTIGIVFALAAAGRGERAALFIFDETIKTLRFRARKLGMPLEQHIESGLITVQQVDPAELSPGPFVSIIRRAVDGEDGADEPLEGFHGVLTGVPALISGDHAAMNEGAGMPNGGDVDDR